MARINMVHSMRQLTAAERERANALLALGEEELLALIGEDVSSDLGARRKGVDERRREASRWIEDNLESIRAALCGNAAIRSAQAGDVAVLLITISDALVAPLKGVPTFAIAALLLKMGLRKLCRDVTS